jgi:hypothetical protein
MNRFIRPVSKADVADEIASMNGPGWAVAKVKKNGKSIEGIELASLRAGKPGVEVEAFP